MFEKTSKSGIIKIEEEHLQKQLAYVYNGEKKVGKVESAKYIFDIHWYEYDGKQYEMKLKYRKMRVR